MPAARLDARGFSDDSGPRRNLLPLLPAERRREISDADLWASAVSLWDTSASLWETSSLWDTSSALWAAAAGLNPPPHQASPSATRAAAPAASAAAASSQNAPATPPPTAVLAPSSPSPAATFGAASAVPSGPLQARPAAQLGSTTTGDSGMNAVAASLLGVSGSVAAAARTAPPALETYGRDMTAAAGKMDPVIGRDDEIDRVVWILCRRTKNSAMLVGAPGVGKTAIAEGLAQRIAAGAVPAALSGVRIVEVDLSAMVAGTKLRGMFEERVKKVIKEAEDADGKVVLFIDEVHMLLGAGQDRGGANLLKPALARGRIRCVGATTFDEHRKYVEKDAAFERRFQKVHVQEPSLLATIDILRGLKKKFEEHHKTAIQDAAIVAVARLANRYIT